MTPVAEDALARALHDLPVAAHAPIARIEQRARSVRRHRRAAGIAGAAVAAAIVAAAFLSGVGNRLDLGPANAPTPCPTTQIDAVPSRPTPDEIPDAMRLLWSESAAPPPTTATAEDLSQVIADNAAYIAACGGPQSVRLVDVEDGLVTRFVWVGSADHLPGSAAQDSDRTLQVGSTSVAIFEPYGNADLPADLLIWPGFVSANWTRGGQGGGQDWLLYGGPVTDAEITELVRLLDHAPDPDALLDLDGWSVLAGAEFVFRSSGTDEWQPLKYEAENDGLRLDIVERPGVTWPQVFVGDLVVDVAGRPGLLNDQEYQVTLHWQPSDGVFARLMGQGDAAQLLAIAQTIAPVPADDERLVQAWASWSSSPGP